MAKRRRNQRRVPIRQGRPYLSRPQIAPQPEFVLHTIFIHDVISTVRKKIVRLPIYYYPPAPLAEVPPPAARIMVAPRIVRRRDSGMRIQWAPMNPFVVVPPEPPSPYRYRIEEYRRRQSRK